MANSFESSIEKAIANITKIKAGIDSLGNSVKGINTEAINKLKFVGQDTKSITNLEGKYKSLKSTIAKLKDTIEQLKQKEIEKSSATAKLTDGLAKQEAALKKLNKANVKAKIDIQQLRKAADLEEKSNNKLAGAYLNLIAKRDIAKQKLQALIDSEKASTAQIKKATAELNKFQGKVNSVNNAVNKIGNNKGFFALGNGIKSLLSAFGIVGGVFLIADIARSAFNLLKKLDALKFALDKVTGSQTASLRATQFLNTISKKFGANVIALTERYTKFSAAAQQTNLTIAQSDEIFRVFTKTAGILGLKADEMSGIFLALEQMLSKGKVTTEELRRQLGERLPGAFPVMARALKVTTAELDRMLRAGEVLSEDALPKLTKEVEKTFGLLTTDEVDTLTASTNNLSNAWTDFVRVLSEGGLTDSLKGIIKLLTEVLSGIGGIIDNFQLLIDLADTRKDRKATFLTDLRDNLKININTNTGLFKKDVEQIQEAVNLAKAERVDAANFVRDFGTLTGTRPDSEKGKTIIDVLDIKIKDPDEKRKEILKQLGVIFDGVKETLSEDGISTIDVNVSVGDRRKKIESQLKNLSTQLRFKPTDEELKQITESMRNLRRELAGLGSERTPAFLANEISKLEKVIADTSDNGKITELQKQIKALAKERDKLLGIPEPESVLFGSRNFFEKKLSDLITQRDNLTTTAKQWEVYTEKIKKAKKAMEEFEAVIASTRKPEERITSGTDNTFSRNTNKENVKFAGQRAVSTPKVNLPNIGDTDIFKQSRLKGEAEEAQKLREEIKKLREEFKSFFKETSDQALGDLGFGSLTKLFDGTLKALLKATDGVEGETIQRIAGITKIVGDIVLDGLNFIDQAQEAQAQNQLFRIQREKEIQLKFAGDSASAKKKIEEDFDRKSRAIQNKRAKQQWKNAIFQSLVNTAVGVTAALAQFNIPLAIAIGILGAAETAFIASQKPPQFEKGTKDAPEGVAIVDEKRPEVHTDSKGRVKSFGRGKANYRQLAKHDKIYPSFENWFTDTISKTGELNGNYFTTIDKSSGLTREDMEDIMAKHFSKIQVLETSYDKTGFRQFIVGENTKTELRNKRATFRGYKR